MLKLNTKYVDDFISKDEMKLNEPIVSSINEMINNKSSLGGEFLGWTDNCINLDENELRDIKSASKKIISDSEVLLVIGIGGSYLGAKAVIDFLSDSFYNLKANKKGLPEIYFAGHNISSTYMTDLKELIDNRDFSINIISKSGTTTEPAIAFRYFRDVLVKKYGEKEANNRIYATTDSKSGALKEQAVANEWQSFVVPDDIGGRFSVLTAVGLLPIACAGINIDLILKGAKKATLELNNGDLNTNDCYKYAVIRNALYKKGKDIEIMVGYEPSLQYFNEWWKQLFGESEGKDNKGIFVSSVIYSTDLHSMGQMIQSGKRNIFETVISIKKPRHEVTIQKETHDLDGLNYLAQKSVDYVNKKAFLATTIAHKDGNVPNIVLELSDMSEESIGYMIYFFERSCAMSGYLLNVNPFDQPGVEEYKKNMFALLGKKGFEEHKNKLEKQ